MENLIIRNNTIRRTDPEFSISLSSGTTSRSWDNVFEFTACKNVVIECNCYDDGMKNYAVISNMPQSNLTNQDEEISVVTNSSLPAGDPVSDLVYVSSDPDVISVDAEGNVTAIGSGTAEVYAYYIWDKTITKSNAVAFTVTEGGVSESVKVEIEQTGTIILNDDTTSAALAANTAVTCTLTKVLDPNDSSRDIPLEVLTATACDWQTGYEATEGPANLVLDNNPSTQWHTNWYGTSRANHWIQFELSENYVVDGLRYLPRSGGSTTGVTPTTFVPDATCTRGQIVSFLYRHMAD